MRQKTSELERPASGHGTEYPSVSGWRAAVFTEDGGPVSHADIKEASDSGANLTIAARPGLIDENQAVTISVEAQHRRFTRKARVRRVQAEGNELRVAVEYIDHVGLDPQTHRLDIGLARIDPACALKLPANIALRQKALPFIELNGVMHVACQDIDNASLANLLERLLKMPVQPWASDEDSLDKKLRQVYGDSRHQAQAAPKTAELNASAVSTGDELLYAAYMRQASDIHIDPGFNGAAIRFRVDGQLEQYSQINANIYAELVSRLKVMAYLDIAEKRQPQDGRFSHQFVSGGRRIDVRVATLPTKYGERVTMRLLAVQTDSLTLEHLGFLQTTGAGSKSSCAAPRA